MNIEIVIYNVIASTLPSLHIQLNIVVSLSHVKHTRPTLGASGTLSIGKIHALSLALAPIYMKIHKLTDHAQKSPKKVKDRRTTTRSTH